LMGAASTGVRAVRPTTERRSAFLAMLDDFHQRDPGNAVFYAAAKTDFGGYVQTLLNEEVGRDLPDGRVPCTHRWLVSPNGEVVGVTRLRHNVDTPFLAESGGHVGFDVAPSYRRRGYGHLALAVALHEARQLKLERVLLYAAEDNAPSRAVIEGAGGELERVFFSDYWNESLCKYWVACGAATSVT
jgi:predicted acetyltransferase